MRCFEFKFLLLLVLAFFLFQSQEGGGCGGGGQSSEESSEGSGAGGSSGGSGGEQVILPCTKYPLVLAHGISGWKELAGYEYFFGVKDYLEGLGCKVFVTQVDAFNTIDVRGNQLADQITKIIIEGGFEKVNIIAHSMGGLDARYAITHRNLGDKVAALVTIATPHQGTVIADVAVGLMEITNTDEIVDFVLSLAGCVIDSQDFKECKQSALKAAEQLTTKYIRETFNPTTPNALTVTYLSYTGKTGLGTKDIVDPLLLAPHLVISLLEGANDGLLSVESSKWGEFLGTVDADHLDEIGQLAGITGLFNHYKFYEGIAMTLKNRGF